MKDRITLLFISLLLATGYAFARPVEPPTIPLERLPGEVETVAGWNDAIPGFANYINSEVVPVLNVLNAKGDIYVYDGADLQKQAVGTNSDVLVADSSRANGIKWAATGSSTTTAKGQLLAHDGDNIFRVAVGSDGQELVADSTTTGGISWQTPATPVFFPVGAIVSWSPAAAGTSTVPTGWVLCDGNNSTPNLIGRFVLGARPNGSGATPSTGGYGALTPDANGTGAITMVHTHTQAGTFATTATGTTMFLNAVAQTPANSAAHTHNLTLSGQTTSTAPALEPSDYVLVYIMKT